jgi:hypothetical protein
MEGIRAMNRLPLIKRSFLYFTQSVVNPRRAFSDLKNENTIVVGFFLNTLKWVLCEFYIYYLFVSDQVLFIPPWLNIPAGSYRYFELFFYIPYGILAWIFTAGIVQTLANVLGGKDDFTGALNIVGVMIFTPFVFIDTIDALFMIINSGDWNILFNSITRTIYVIWSGVLLVFGLNIIHELKINRSILIAFLVIPLTIFINLIFVR